LVFLCASFIRYYTAQVSRPPPNTGRDAFHFYPRPAFVPAFFLADSSPLGAKRPPWPTGCLQRKDNRPAHRRDAREKDSGNQVVEELNQLRPRCKNADLWRNVDPHCVTVGWQVALTFAYLGNRIGYYT
jgi:hypothetical protein